MNAVLGWHRRTKTADNRVYFSMQFQEFWQVIGVFKLLPEIPGLATVHLLVELFTQLFLGFTNQCCRDIYFRDSIKYWLLLRSNSDHRNYRTKSYVNTNVDPGRVLPVQGFHTFIGYGSGVKKLWQQCCNGESDYLVTLHIVCGFLQPRQVGFNIRGKNIA